MVETVLISTFYSFEPLVAAAHVYSPSKIVLLIAEETISHTHVKETLAKARDIYSKVAKMEVIKINGTDVFASAEKVSELLDKMKGRRIIVSISGGKKLMSQGVLYGCYSRPELVDKIVCNDMTPDNRLIELPKLNFGLTSAKKELLQEIAARKGRSIAEISKKLDKTRGMLYQHLKELKESGYVDDKFEITLAGRLALI